jgi:predicted CXXCH cytochrome family protein
MTVSSLEMCMPGLNRSRSQRSIVQGGRLALLLTALLVAPVVHALDPAHDASWAIDCSSCHTTHSSAGGSLTTVGGNGNLCLSCHLIGGVAEAFPFVDADQALPGPGLPSGTVPSGTSHRWDAGAAGHIKSDPGNTSEGGVAPGGVFNGKFSKTYTLTITASGDVGTAVFSWNDTLPLGGSGVGLTIGVDVPLDEGVTVTFVDGAASPSFLGGDIWRIFVRTDLLPPTDPAMSARLEDGRTMCSTCHDQHKQAREPFDASAPPYGGAGTGEGRHFMRIDNDEGNMCNDCHSVRTVTASADGSHPVGLSVPGSGNYQPPSTLPLDPVDRVVCMTCHQLHDSPADDGSLLRSADRVGLCVECHTLADTATPAAHFDSGSTGALWPGGQYGSTFPAITDTNQTATCAGCHLAHGWPDTADTDRDYPRLQLDLEESLCFTCHDGSPASADVWTDFEKSSIHPVGLASEVHQIGEPAIVAARHVECEDCHGPHEAVGRINLPGAATVPRPASGPLEGVQGVNLAGNSVRPASYEYELCFRCHADSPNLPSPSTPRQFPESNLRLEFNGSLASYHPVAMAGTNASVPSLADGWDESSLMSCTTCHNNDDGPVAGGLGANGPHGSEQPHLLERSYLTTDGTNFDEANFAMCFKCHSWTEIESDSSFSDHKKHISGEDTPCNVCHDPHASAKPKLINFDTSVVSPSNAGTLSYVSTGTHSGSCTLNCHGKNHQNWTY